MSQFLFSKKVVTIVIVSLIASVVLFYWKMNKIRNSCLSVKTVWGAQVVTDPCAIELINTPMMQRLQYIDQSGPQSYFGIVNGQPTIVPHFSRFEHSVGVYLLLVKAGVSHDQQIAGLMHDASHTVFSHLGDMLFGNGDGAKSYQDGIHIDCLRSHKEVMNVLGKYKIHVEDMDPDKEDYTALERPLPDLCADRIQYIIHTGVLLQRITSAQASQIIDDLEFKNGLWFFKNKETAVLFANISLHCLQALWGSEENQFFYLLFKHILLRAIAIGLVTADDLHYSVDQVILDRLQASDDSYIQRLLTYTQDWYKHYTVVKYDESDIHYKIKFRGVNPLVFTDNGLKRLTDIDHEYAQEYEKQKQWCHEGYGLKLHISFQ